MTIHTHNPNTELSAAEQHQILVEWNHTQADYPKDQCIHQLFEAQVEQTPHAIAVVFEAQQLTYHELNGRANQLAHYLQSLGVKPEVLVGLCVERGLEMLVGLLGILKAGGAYVPLDPNYPKQRLAFMLADSQVPILLTQEKLTARLPEHQAQIVCLETSTENFPKGNPISEVTSSHLAYVIYTSGSTGTPKGVQINHLSLLNFLMAMRQQPGLTSSDVLFAITTISFDIAALELYLPLIVGAKIVLASSVEVTDGLRLLEKLNHYGITVMQATPATWHLLLMSGWKTTLKLKILCGGEALSSELATQLLKKGQSLWNLYGPTETTVWSTIAQVSARDNTSNTISIGRPIANTQIYILDANAQLLPVGVSGELHIGGAGVARGYLNQAELTAEKFIKNPFSDDPNSRIYKTGDLARYLPDGQIEFLGRLDNQVKIRGFRIELGEIETVLAQHPAVQQAVVMVWEVKAGDKRLVAYIIPHSKPAPKPNELHHFLKKQLPDYMVPATFVTLEKLPLTPNGKIDRKALPTPDPLERIDGEWIAPRTPIEEVLTTIWIDILDSEQIGTHDNFFELGGHSLLITQVISRVRETLKVELPISSLFDYPTLVELAQHIDRLLKQPAYLQLVPAIQPISRPPNLPLSYLQEQLWFLAQLNPNIPFYNESVTIHINTILDVIVLEHSFNAIIRRHEALRTIFVTVDGQPVQKIMPPPTLNLPVIDLSLLPLKQREVQARQLATEQAKQLFDLTQDMLLRAILVRLGKTQYRLFLTIHHIIIDGVSFSVFLQELALFYQAFSANHPSPLPKLPIQYPDFAHWQRQQLSTEMVNHQLSYWKTILDDNPPMLQWPSFQKRPMTPTFRGAKQYFTLAKNLTEALNRLSQLEGVTLFMTLLAAFKILLYRYSGQDDIAIGTVAAVRQQPELEKMIGYFLNTLVLRTELKGTLTFQQLLALVRQVTLGAMSHNDLPFVTLVETLHTKRHLGQNPLFQVAFTLDPSMPEIDLGWTLTQSDIDNGTAKFDLYLGLEEKPGGINGRIEYSTDLFDTPTIERMIGHFQILLEGIVASPGQRISALPLLTECEQHQLLVQWNDTQTNYSKDKCIHHLFEEQVEQIPEAVAVVFEEQQITYRELNAKANQLAYQLQILGVAPEVLVGIYLQRSLEMIIGVMGILKAGGAYVPLDTNWPPERIQYILASQGIEHLVTQYAQLPTLQALQWQLSALKNLLCLDLQTPKPPPEALNPKEVQTLWDTVAQQATDEITAGGFISSYTREPFSAREVAEYKNLILKLVQPDLAQNKRVLEIGCGAGLLMFAIAPQVDFYVGLDPSEVTQVRNQSIIVEQGYTNIKLKTAFAHDINTLDEASFDLIIIASTVQFFPGYFYLQQVIEMALDNLVPGGTLLIADVMDPRQKEAFKKSLETFQQNQPAHKQSRTKTHLESELYIDENFFYTLPATLSEVSVFKRQTGFNNELRYRYDVILKKKKATDEYVDPPTVGLQIWTAWHLNQLATKNPVTKVTPKHLAYIIYTSGSTGTPKGVMVRHQPVINLIEWVNQAFQVGVNDRILSVTSLCFDLSVYDIFGLLATGGSIQVASESVLKNPEQLLHLLYNQPITFWNSVPAFFQQLVPLLKSSNTINHSLRLVFLSGDWIPVTLPETIKTAFPGTQVIGLGGATEATVWSNYYPIKEIHPHWMSIPYGKPIQNAKYYILDQNLNPALIGIPGHLYIGGECLACGYNDPYQTAQKFIPDPFSADTHARLYHTGDLARYYPDGNIEFLGRLDNQVKIRGFRIELGEIETVLAQHAGVQEVVVIVREDQLDDKRLVAYIVPNQALNLATSTLRHSLKEKLPDYMIPSAFIMLEAMPLTPNGKLDRRALVGIVGRVERSETHRAPEKTFVTPRDVLELQLAKIWENILDVRPISVQDNFFELGGHSLLAIRLMAEIQQQFEQNLPLATLFQGATIEHLAKIIRQQIDFQSGSPLVAIQPHGSKRPFFCMPGSGGNVIYFHQLARHLGKEQPFYALQAKGVDGKSAPLTAVEYIATYYLEAIRTVQSQGPYLLGGHSFGALVAFEMAQQLSRQGQNVALLAILDLPALHPDRQPTELDWDEAKWMATIAQILESLSGKHLALCYEDFQPLDTEAQLTLLSTRLESVNLLPPEAGINYVHSIVQVIKADELAFLRYVPSTGYPNRITLFKTSEVYQDELGMLDEEIPVDPAWGWGHLSTEQVEVHVVPGNHTSMLTEPQVQVLADKLKYYFE